MPKPSRRALLVGAALAATPLRWSPSRAATGMAQALAYTDERRGVSLLVLHQGRRLVEHYANGGNATAAWELASGTKSFCGLIAAAAVADGLLTLDQPVAESLTEWRSDQALRAITPQHLLTLTAGFHSPIGRAPSYADAIKARPVDPPGQRFRYGPLCFQIFGEVMRRRLAGSRDRDPLAYLQRRILMPAGVEVAGWRRGADGMPLLPQGARLTARAWGQFGTAMMAMLAGAPGSLDPAAVRALTQPTSANPGYGLSWWLFRRGLVPPGPGVGFGRTFPPAVEQEDCVVAAGAGNQRLYLLRKRGLVVVRQAEGLGLVVDQTPRWDDATFLSLLLNAL
ncbi:MAG: serine hydrolase domain-containing protein [Alphaproteobacteria bacterium]|nr:serine hydrolase domain-containing protein [Alphaproteobacteria bacterium]